VAKVSTYDLGEALHLGSVPDDEAVVVLTSALGMSGWDEGQRVSYFHSEQGHVLDAVYAKKVGRILAYEPTPNLTPEIADGLRAEFASAFDPDLGFEVRREIFFSVPEIKGTWRHGDDWQILPKPSHAPRPFPDSLGKEQAFVLEFRIRTSPHHTLLETRRSRRRWELHLLLAFVLRGTVKPEVSAPGEQRWVVFLDPETDTSKTAYAGEGYKVGGRGFVVRDRDFSEPEAEPLGTLPDEDYYARIGLQTEMDVPASIDSFFDRFEAAPHETREKMLRACYWFSASYRMWHALQSLSFVSAINAVEALLPESEQHECSVCGKEHRYPGPTQLFRDFVERYAQGVPKRARSDMYDLRSSLLHGTQLHGSDVPRAWSGIIPSVQRHEALHRTALEVARTSVRNWFLDETRQLDVGARA
jgi:hypothetical protein